MEAFATFDPTAPDPTDAMDDAINALVRLGNDSAAQERALRAVFFAPGQISPWARRALERRLPVKEYAR